MQIFVFTKPMSRFPVITGTSKTFRDFVKNEVYQCRNMEGIDTMHVIRLIGRFNAFSIETLHLGFDNLWIRQKLCNGSQCRHTDSPVVSSSFSVAMFSDDFDELLSRSFFFF